ncbi:cell division protein FtsZ [Patescibacteria group bacterium]|nr:cell division protein FtsZ [Patescibacteria group bacterium]
MQIKPKIETFARIKVLGIGGSGTNAVHRMTELGIRGVEFVAVNTDAQALHNSHADKKVHIGKTVTRGLGAGMNPDQGRQAAEESRDDIQDVVENADMIFITCGLGGGTGTGAAPIIAELAKNLGILTVAVVTKPFTFEGTKRKEIAEEGYSQLKDKVDAIISISNDRILQIIDKKTSLIDAFRTVDDVLRQGIQGISDLITTHGIVNADFADVRTIMQDAGTALMGIGSAAGENRAAEAARNAINSPLLELAIDGAKGVLFNITGGRDLGMFEIDEAAKIITKSVDPEAKIKFGAVIDDTLKDEVKITVIATGFDEMQRKPSSIRISETEDFGGISHGFKKMDDIKREEPAVKKEEPRRIFEEPKQTYQEKPQQAEEPKESRRPLFGSTPPVEDTGDELDIPAFIRKKMK